jgi:tryptophan synthase alpha chain
VNRIKKRFEELKKQGKKAFISFITAGDPDFATSKALVLELEKRGADIIELGVPFSDPLAEGPVIQRSSQRALKKGTSLPRILALVRELRQETEISIILMGYYNPIFKFGEREFIEKTSQAEVDGLIIVDLPPEEANFLLKEAKENDLALIPLLTPVSSEDRIKLVCQKSQGFIYCVAYTGITGDERREDKNLKDLVAKVHSLASTPVGIGFGISSPSEARKTASLAEAVIVGSAIVKKIEKHQGNKALVEKVGDFAESLAKAVKE